MSRSAINHFMIILRANPKISSEYERCVRSDEGGGVKYGFRDAFFNQDVGKNQHSSLFQSSNWNRWRCSIRTPNKGDRGRRIVPTRLRTRKLAWRVVFAVFVYRPHHILHTICTRLHVGWFFLLFCSVWDCMTLSYPVSTCWAFPRRSFLRASWSAWGLKLVSGNARGQLKGNIQPKVEINQAL